jgi:putative transposase
VALCARLVLAAAEGLPKQKIAVGFHVTANTVGKWRTWHALHGVSGPTDYEHPGRPPKYGSEVQDKLHNLLRKPPTSGRERWTVREVAQELKMPRSTIHEMLIATDFKNLRRPVRRRPRY